MLIDEYVAQHHLPPITLKDVVPYVSGEQTADGMSESENN